MYRFFYKKLINLLFSLFLISTLTFFLMKLVPGDPFTEEKVMAKEVLDALYRHYGLDQPLWKQYLTNMKQIITCNLGPSLIYQGRTVEKIILQAFPVSAKLGIQTLVFSLFMGISLGSIAAVFRSRWQDRSLMMLTTLGICIPSFLLASLLQYFFAIKWSILPVARFSTFAHSILPTLALSTFPISYISRLTRSNIIEVLSQDYIKTAYAKGLHPIKVIIKHALRNAILPLISYLGPITARIITGSFIIEKIFGIPGLGSWLVTSILSRDYPIIMGLTIFYSALLLTMTFLVDVAYRWIDPRMEIELS